MVYSSSSSTVKQKNPDVPGGSKKPLWLYRIENDEMSTLLRASSNYARHGYDPTLAKQKERAVNSLNPTHRHRKQFENTMLTGGSVPIQYLSKSTGRSLTTALPHDRPVTGQRPPSPVGKELLHSMEVREQLKRNKGKDNSDAIIDAALGPSESSRIPKIEPSRIPLSQIKGLVHHPVADQLVSLPSHLFPNLHDSNADQDHYSLSHRRNSLTTVGGHGGSIDDDPPDKERLTLPKASDVLKRYKMFTVRTDPAPNRNLNALLNPPTIDHSKHNAPVKPAAIVASGRAQLLRSGTTTQLGPSMDAQPAGTLPTGAMSHAILQNRLGNTHLGGDTLPRGGSGLVVGDLFISHDLLTPATLIIAKWGRIANTTYGKNGEPCRLRCEMQPLYYESFIADMNTTIGMDRFSFTPDVQPAVFLVDIGSVNAAIHGHRPSHVRPPAIGNENFQYKQGIVDGSISEHHSTADEGEDTEDEDDEEGEESNPPGKKKSSIGTSKFSLMDVAKARHDNDSLVVDDLRQRRQKLAKIKKKRKKKVPTQDEIRRAELRLAMDLGKEKANELLLKLAKDGNDFALAQILTKGYKIDYNPNPWYLKMAEESHKKRMAARSRNLGGEVPTDPDAPPPRNLAGYSEGKKTEPIGDSQGSHPHQEEEEEEKSQGVTKKQPEVYVLPEVNVRDPDGNTPLMNAARNGWADACLVLLKHGADHTRKNDQGQTALDLAKAESNMASLALGVQIPGAADRKRRAAKLVQILDDRTVLVCAQKGDLRRLQYLVDDCDHPINAQNQYGMVPLHFAVMRKDIPMIKFLSERGGDINARNNLGQTPLSLAMDMVGDVFQSKILEALAAGDVYRAQEEAKRQAQLDDQQYRLENEKYLIRELKTATKGTTAAKAVHLALNHVKNPSFGPPSGTKLEPIDHLGYHNRQNTTLTSIVNVPGLHVPSSTAHHDTHYSSYSNSGGNLTGRNVREIPNRPIPLNMKQAAMTDPTALAESWNRHVLNYLAVQQKEAKTKDIKRAIAARELDNEVQAARRRMSATNRKLVIRDGSSSNTHYDANMLDNSNPPLRPDTAVSVRGNPPSSSLGIRITGMGGPITALSGGNLRTTTPHGYVSSQATLYPSSTLHSAANEVEDAVRSTFIRPGALSEAQLRKEPIPAADSAKFEHWARMRFGVL